MFKVGEKYYNNFSKYTGINGEYTVISIDSEFKQTVFDLLYCQRMSLEEIAIYTGQDIDLVESVIKGLE